MSKLPKLKIKLPFGNSDEDICELEQAKYRFSFGGNAMVLIVDGQVPQSYEELVQLATQDKYKNKEFINAELIIEMFGGG